MGFKFLTLQRLPWCFHLMGKGNHVPCARFQPAPPVRTIKIIKSDGLVKIYRRPINVSELMLEYPKHLVCHSDSFFIGQKIPALSEDDQLQLGHKYFLLPKHFFQTVLSFATIASFASSQSQSQSQSRSQSSSLSINSKNAFLKKAARCQPFDIQKTPSGSLQIRVSDDFISKLMEEGRIKEDHEEEDSSKPVRGVCTTPELQKDYTQLVGTRQWKPKLETIRESQKRKLGSFGMKRRKKSQSEGTQKTQRSEKVVHGTSTKPPSKTKIKIKGRKGLEKFRDSSSRPSY
ncbi:hypothetical protein HHK36_032111 [Tetracentron sinense]|uniref:DUF4228 domain protein n=1 Tax=Tetracentron sinense TaxID=13715 RepID=A0A834Y8N9_TETSI|nr:hypothetical protein HHK36_032111 [Tetracentron sinense]